MDDRRPPNPYRPDPPLFEPVSFDDPEPLVRPRRRRDEVDEPQARRPRPDSPERPEREAPIFDSDDDVPYTGAHEQWNWDDEDVDDFGRERGGRGGGRGSGRGGRGGGYASDRGLLRIVALLAVLAIVVVALVVPGSPVRIIGGSSSPASTGTEGITASARDSIPALPNGFTALSKIYDVKVPANAKGPWSIEVALTEKTTDGNNLGFYAYDGSRWTRVANVKLAQDGASVSGDVTSPPGTVAVLRRSGQAKALALIVQAGDRLDAKAIDATSIVAVMGASLGSDGALQATNGALQSVASTAGKAKVYLGVSDGAETTGLVKNLASQGAMTSHAEAMAVAAKGQNAAGVFLDYRNVPGAQKDTYVAFAKVLRERLQKDQLGLIVGVPASAGANGAYDWNALLSAADGLWVRGVSDPAAYYDQMDQLFTARKSGNTDLGKVSLIIDRRSTEKRGQQFTPITLRDALTAASTIDKKAEATPAAAGGTIAVRAQNLGDAQQGAGLRWDTTSRSVAFAYSGGDGAHNVWVENRFSAGFRMDLASRFNLGGIVVDQAKQDDALPDIWGAVVTYAQDGSAKLERPFGPYLAPCWQAVQGAMEGTPACWSADSAPTTANWRAPKETGSYAVRLVVSDGATFVAQEVALRVGTGAPTLTTTATPSTTPTPTPTARPGGTAAPTATATTTPRPTATATATPTPTATATPSGGTPTPPPIQTSTPVPTPPPATPTPATTPFPGGVPPGPAGQ